MLNSTSTSDYFAVTDTSATSAALVAGQVYRVAVSVDCYIAMNSAAPTASAADNNHYIAAGRPFYFQNLTTDHKIALIRVGAVSGVATVSLAMRGE